MSFEMESVCRTFVGALLFPIEISILLNTNCLRLLSGRLQFTWNYFFSTRKQCVRKRKKSLNWSTPNGGGWCRWEWLECIQLHDHFSIFKDWVILRHWTIDIHSHTNASLSVDQLSCRSFVLEAIYLCVTIWWVFFTIQIFFYQISYQSIPHFNNFSFSISMIVFFSLFFLVFFLKLMNENIYKVQRQL